jgi:predicted MFS family arabinose efflux permease
MNVDMGIMAAGTTSIQTDLKMDKGQYGTLGSVVYFGQILGSVGAAGLLAKNNAKYILIWCLILNLGALNLFTMTKTYWVLVLSRGLTGLFQISFAIFMPVWASAFGNAKQQALWMTYLMITSPLGVIMGYILNGFFHKTMGW